MQPHGSSEYLIQRFELVNEPMAAFLSLAPRSTGSPAATGKLAIFADPVYNLSDTRLMRRATATTLQERLSMNQLNQMQRTVLNYLLDEMESGEREAQNVFIRIFESPFGADASPLLEVAVEVEEHLARGLLGDLCSEIKGKSDRGRACVCSLTLSDMGRTPAAQF